MRFELFILDIKGVGLHDVLFSGLSLVLNMPDKTSIKITSICNSRYFSRVFSFKFTGGCQLTESAQDGVYAERRTKFTNILLGKTTDFIHRSKGLCF